MQYTNVQYSNLCQVKVKANQIIVSGCLYGILFLCFCSFGLFCPLLDKDSFIKHLYIALSCPIK